MGRTIPFFAKLNPIRSDVSPSETYRARIGGSHPTLVVGRSAA